MIMNNNQKEEDLVVAGSIKIVVWAAICICNEVKTIKQLFTNLRLKIFQRQYFTRVAKTFYVLYDKMCVQSPLAVKTHLKLANYDIYSKQS